jgi:hypothetical protein
VITPDLLATCAGGIIFTGESVRAIREGRKTRTTRLMKPQPPEWCDSSGWTCFTPNGKVSFRGRYPERGPAEKFLPGPRYQPGKRYYVKETWQAWPICVSEYDDSGPLSFEDIRDGVVAHFEYAAGPTESLGPWRSPRHMPRRAARYAVEIVTAKALRLHDTTEEMARAEGVTPLQMDHGSFLPSFEGAWDALNGKRAPWDSNPWVWSYELTFME